LKKILNVTTLGALIRLKALRTNILME